MSLGEKIFELRKKQNLSQEELAEKLYVTRQTISKWELNETVPNIKQAKELAQIFKISLDELTDNNIEDILMEKVSNTEKLAGLIIKILKIVGIAFVVLLIIDIIALILYTSTGKLANIGNSATIYCQIEDKKYEISFVTDKSFECINCSNKMNNEIKDLVNFNDVETSIKNIETYFETNNGICE